MDRTKTQNRVILSYLKAGGRLSSLKALDLCGTTRLAARIMDLRNAGHDIVTTRKNMKVESGAACSYAEYFIPDATGMIQDKKKPGRPAKVSAPAVTVEGGFVEKKRRGRPPKNK